MDKTKADILYDSLANFTDEEGAIECGAKMRDFARELEIELNEQVACNGKGAEREAALLGKVERLERENARILSNEASINDQICELATQLSKLREAAQSVVDRWETPLWKKVEPTAALIYRLRDSLPNVEAQR
jgi:hypothetical protein